MMCFVTERNDLIEGGVQSVDGLFEEVGHVGVFSEGDRNGGANFSMHSHDVVGDTISETSLPVVTSDTLNKPTDEGLREMNIGFIDFGRGLKLVNLVGNWQVNFGYRVTFMCVDGLMRHRICVKLVVISVQHHLCLFSFLI